MASEIDHTLQSALQSALNSADLSLEQRAEIRRELAHRFRLYQRCGQLSPLLHIMLRYKLEWRR